MGGLNVHKCIVHEACGARRIKQACSGGVGVGIGRWNIYEKRVHSSSVDVKYLAEYDNNARINSCLESNLSPLVVKVSSIKQNDALAPGDKFQVLTMKQLANKKYRILKQSIAEVSTNREMLAVLSKRQCLDNTHYTIMESNQCITIHYLTSSGASVSPPTDGSNLGYTFTSKSCLQNLKDAHGNLCHRPRIYFALDG